MDHRKGRPAHQHSNFIEIIRKNFSLFVTADWARVFKTNFIGRKLYRVAFRICFGKRWHFQTCCFWFGNKWRANRLPPEVITTFYDTGVVCCVDRKRDEDQWNQRIHILERSVAISVPSHTIGLFANYGTNWQFWKKNFHLIRHQLTMVLAWGT